MQGYKAVTEFVKVPAFIMSKHPSTGRNKIAALMTNRWGVEAIQWKDIVIEREYIFVYDER